MKQKTAKIKSFLLALTLGVMGFSVILSSMHAKDIARVSASPDASTVARISDVTAKAFGDLHNHIDKQTLKNISLDNPMTAREREIKALNEEKASRTIPELLEDTFAYYRLVFALSFSAVFA